MPMYFLQLEPLPQQDLRGTLPQRQLQAPYTSCTAVSVASCALLIPCARACGIHCMKLEYVKAMATLHECIVTSLHLWFGLAHTRLRPVLPRVICVSSRTRPPKKRYWPTACVCLSPPVPLSYNVEVTGESWMGRGNEIKVNIEFRGQGGSSGCLGQGVFKMLLREANTFFCGGGVPKNHSFGVWKPRKPIGMKSLWSVRCATLSASVSFVQAFRFAGGSASSMSAWCRRP